MISVSVTIAGTLLIVAVIVFYRRSGGGAPPSDYADIKRRLDIAESEIRARTADNLKLEDKAAELENMRKQMELTFKNLANEIIASHSKNFSEGSQEKLGGIINPFKEQLDQFRRKVEEAQKESNAGTAKLEGWIKSLAEQHRKMSEGTENLTRALRGSAKAQGDWGEFILRDLLEKTGLLKNELFTFQEEFNVPSEESGALKKIRTDVIVRMPHGRHLVIDSKVSLNAYTDYAGADDDAARNDALKRHIASVRGHIKSLSESGYDRLPNRETPDFVVMFVPVEPAFLTALQSDENLWADAYKRGILLAGPTTLLYVIRIVNMLWVQERQLQNVNDILTCGTSMLNKFTNFIDDMENIGKHLNKANETYDDAFKKLYKGKGNLIGLADKMRNLGVSSKRELPPHLLDTSDDTAISTEIEYAVAEDEN